MLQFISVITIHKYYEYEFGLLKIMNNNTHTHTQLMCFETEVNLDLYTQTINRKRF